MHDQRGRPQAVHNHVDTAVKIGADPVHLVDETHPRHAVFIGLTPNGFRLRLHASDRVKHRDRAIEHAQGPFHLDGEIHVARRVDDVDPIVAPEGRGRRRSDGDAALLLLLHPVHGGVAIVDLTNLIGLTGVVEDTLGGRRLAGIDVGHDADITITLEGVFACHNQSVLSADYQR